MLSMIQWGIPNGNHPFSYHMDEWHFLESIRAVIHYGTTTISGAGHIPFFHVISTIVFFIPFIILGIVHPFSLHSSLDNLTLWEQLFIVLRLHTLLYGVLSIITFYFIAQEYSKKFPIVITSFFVITPIFLMLSNYYKYDITLLFWILLTIFFSLKYGNTKKFYFFYFTAISSGFALATKFSALPLLPSLFILFFIFTPSKNKMLKKLGIAILICISIFLLFGVPDLLLGKGNYKDLLESNLVSGPNETNFFVYPYPVIVFLVKDIYPILFGHVLFFFSALSILYMSFLLLFQRNMKNLHYKKRLLIFSIFILFSLSLLTLRILATGNRVLVLLPFLVLISADVYKDIYQKLDGNKIYQKIFLLLLFLVFISQAIESFLWVNLKLHDAPQVAASKWMQKNIPAHTTIGLENIPIYQSIPDIALKEFYMTQSHKLLNPHYEYSIVTGKEKRVPTVVILTNKAQSTFYSNSSKRPLLSKLKEIKYKERIRFDPDWSFLSLLTQEEYLVHSGLIASVQISFYQK